MKNASFSCLQTKNGNFPPFVNLKLKPHYKYKSLSNPSINEHVNQKNPQQKPHKFHCEICTKSALLHCNASPQIHRITPCDLVTQSDFSAVMETNYTKKKRTCKLNAL